MTFDQNDTDFVDHLTGELNSAPEPTADDALLARIHATLAATDEQAKQSSPSRWPWQIATAAAAVLLIAAIVRGTRPVTAGSMTGTLHFDPATPQPGQTIRVRYEPAATLARFDRVRLRARFRTSSDIPSTWFESQVTAAQLTRDRTGAFVGSFLFPDSVVFGAFAVEDESARYVDSNRRSLWTLLASDSTGTPTFEALEQRTDDIATTNWELSLATMARATKIHPDQVRGWVILYTLQQSILTRAARDSVTAAHRARLPLLDDRFSRGGVTSDELGAMVSFAEMFGDTTRARRWMAQLTRSNPRGIWGINPMIAVGSKLLAKSPRDAHAFYDSLWTAVGGVHPGVANFGIVAAQAAKDSAAVSIWFRRALSSGNVDTAQTATMMLRTPGLADEALALLRSLLVTTPASFDSRRDLELTRAAAQPVEDDRRARILESLGTALVGLGQTRAGVDTLALAASIGWNPPLYRKLAATAFALGDTARALDALAHAAADPATVGSLADSARTIAGASFDSAAWITRVARARTEMKRRMLSRAERTVLPNVTLVDSTGRSRSLGDL
jgi:hypothetical protein